MKARFLFVPAIVAMVFLSSCGPKVSKFAVADEQPDGGTFPVLS